MIAAPDTRPAEAGLAAAWPAAVQALPTAVVAAVGLVIAWRDGGSVASEDWLGWTLVVDAVLVVVLVSGTAGRPPRRTIYGATALLLLAAWTALTLVWSAVPSLARDEALLVTVYVAALLVPAVTLRGPAARTAAAAAIVALLGGTAVAVGVHLARADSGASYLTGRLDFPITYPNAQAALFLIGLWPALALAATRSFPTALRAAALAAAAGLAGGWSLTQSKGGAIGIAVAAIVVFAVSPQRLRLLVPTLLVAALTAVAFLPLTGPFRASDATLVHAMRRAGKAEILLVLGGVAVGAVYAALDRRLEVSPRARSVGGAAALLGLVAALATVGAVFVARVDHPIRWVDARWHSFKHEPTRVTVSTHFLTLGSNRYDFWRVAIHEFDRHWLSGIGARGFRAAYLQHRRSHESPARSHSLELDELSEEGVIGFALLVAAIGLLIAECGHRARSELAAVGFLGAAVGFVAHASVDWIWTFPAVGVPLFALVGAGASGAGERRLRAREYGTLAAATAAVAIVGLLLPWVSYRYTVDALHHPSRAAPDLHRARQLDPLSVDPYLAAWAIAPTKTAAIAPLEQAVRKQPRVADLWYALGRQQLLAGRKADARRTLSVALFLDPNDPVILVLYRRASR